MVAKSKTLRYRGPAQQVCYDLGRFGYAANLVPGAVYELPADFAGSLMRSNAHMTLIR